MKKIFLLSLFLYNVSHASTLVEVLPISNKVIMLHFDDGYVIHHKLGQNRTDEKVVGIPLDVSKADKLTSFNIIENGLLDLNFKLSRKSKATDFTWLCQAWNGSCVNTDADVAKEHWIYLQVSKDMTNGSSYKISFPGFPEFTSVSFVFNDKKQRSEFIRVNQIGYANNAKQKFGYIYHWIPNKTISTDDLNQKPFYLINTKNEAVVFEGLTKFRKPFNNQEIAYKDQTPDGNFCGEDVYECDFSLFNQDGNYVLCVKDYGCSFPFDIKKDAYFDPYKAIMNGLYQQRSGIATLAPFTSQPRPVPHNPSLTPGFKNKLKYSSFKYTQFTTGDGSDVEKANIESNIKGNLDVSGWYQDAGDWDSYYSHTDVPSKLLWLYEMGVNVWKDAELSLPENNNGFPDLLDEGSWLPRFHYKLRKEMKDKKYGTGGVGGGRVFGDLWGGDEKEDGTTMGSWQDTSRLWVCTGEDAIMTYKYAGIAAHIAYILKENNLVDPQGIDWKNEALEAYDWATKNTKVEDEKLFDLPISHLQIYASANLFRLTNEVSYLNTFRNTFENLKQEEVNFSDEFLFGLAALYKAKKSGLVNATLLASIKNKILLEADFILLESVNNRACRFGGNFYFPMLVGQGTTPLIKEGIIAHHLFREEDEAKGQKYENGIHTTADYFLGNNTLNMCWISGLGERNPEEIFNIDAWYLGGDVARQGIVPYGPWFSDGDMNGLGPWSHKWPNKFVFPNDINEWPGHERWFNQRTCPLTNEYTIYQTLGNSIFTYGYLHAINSKSITKAVEIENPNNTLTIYPNPAFDNILLDGIFIGDEISIYDASGKLIYFQNYNGEKIPINNFKNGIYFVKVSSKTGHIKSGKFYMQE